jgi:hypothetical protein
MATKKLRELRLRYKAAYTAYMNCVHEMALAALQGEWPSEDVLEEEEKALNELNAARGALLDALHAHTEKARA